MGGSKEQAVGGSSSRHEAREGVREARQTHLLGRVVQEGEQLVEEAVDVEQAHLHCIMGVTTGRPPALGCGRGSAGGSGSGGMQQPSNLERQARALTGLEW